MEKTLRLNLSLLVLGAILVSSYKKKKWSVLSIVTATFLAQHLLSKSCPSFSFFKRFGLQTRQEIEHEKYALKALRGDFKNIQNNVDKAWNAVNTEKDRRVIGFKRDDTMIQEKGNSVE
jgi:esterase/lipase